jgi:microcystin-dependent protein
MSTPYIGEIRMLGFGTRAAPNSWQSCDGSLLPISLYDALYTLIGTTYGGDGQSTFAVPDMRGHRVMPLTGRPASLAAVPVACPGQTAGAAGHCARNGAGSAAPAA